jgi:hypothetical protein
MAKQSQAPAQGNNGTTKKLGAFVARNYKADGEDRTHWTRVGTAFPVKDGTKILLDAVPVNGELFLFELQDDDQRG